MREAAGSAPPKARSAAGTTLNSLPGYRPFVTSSGCLGTCPCPVSFFCAGALNPIVQSVSLRVSGAIVPAIAAGFFPSRGCALQIAGKNRECPAAGNTGKTGDDQRNPEVSRKNLGRTGNAGKNPENSRVSRTVFRLPMNMRDVHPGGKPIPGEKKDRLTRVSSRTSRQRTRPRRRPSQARLRRSAARRSTSSGAAGRCG